MRGPPGGRPAAIEVRSLSVGYGGRAALRDVSFRVAHGEVVLVTGPTGCGKSTLALALSGLIPHAQTARCSGRVIVDGLPTDEHPPHELSARAGMVFQNPATQLFHTSVEEEVAFAPRNVGLSEPEVRLRTCSALSSVGIGHLGGRATRTLSMGEKQRLAIASVLSLEPRILILDEPTANLDRSGVRQVVGALKRLNRERGVTILVFEHRLAAFYPWATRVMVLEEGSIVADDPPREPFARSRLERLGLSLPAPEGDWDVGGVFVRDGEARPRPGPFLVQLQDVAAGYGARPCLEGLRLQLFPGELAALVGSNGAGKSTVARVLTGMLRPRKGRVLWDPALRALPLGRRVGFLHHDVASQLLLDTVREEVAYAARNFRLPAEALLETTLRAADLRGLCERLPCSLSAGEQQRTALAATLSADPRLLILDEPTVGQDWEHLGSLMSHLQDLKRQGKSILVITHDERLVRRFADRILHLRGGRIAAEVVRGPKPVRPPRTAPRLAAAPAESAGPVKAR